MHALRISASMSDVSASISLQSNQRSLMQCCRPVISISLIENFLRVDAGHASVLLSSSIVVYL